MLVSAACSAALGVLTQLAYRAGVSELGVLWGRYVLAAAVLWLLVLPCGRAPSRRVGRDLLSARIYRLRSGASLSSRTVEKHVERILTKTGQTKRTALAAFAIGVESGPTSQRSHPVDHHGGASRGRLKRHSLARVRGSLRGSERINGGEPASRISERRPLR